MNPYWQGPDLAMYVGDVRAVLAELPERSVHCCVTSPPYWSLRSYLPSDHPDKGRELGSEPTPDLYIANMVEVFRGVKRVLRDDGTLWLNCGDSFVSSWSCNRQSKIGLGSPERTQRVNRRAGALKEKDLVGIPWMLAFALRADGWYLRSAITWCKTAPMPESVQDRPTCATEMIFLLTKRGRYYYDSEAVREKSVSEHPSGNGFKRPQRLSMGGRGSDEQWQPTAGRNLWNYWLLSPEPYAEAHFATFPSEIPRRAILAGTSEYGVCGACGAPWKRVTEKNGATQHGGPRKRADAPGAETSPTSVFRTGTIATTMTTGWAPTCSCQADVVPSTVLDPFGGSGTTTLVARQLGRQSVYIDLSEEYANLAIKRLEGQPWRMPGLA